MSENQRVRLSKQCLRESLIRLLKEKSIHKISVREICEEAQINRTTFYKYYGSQYALLSDMENEVLMLIDKYLGNIDDIDENAARRLESILSYAQDNADLFRLLIGNKVDTGFLQRIINLPMVRQLLKEQLTAGYAANELEYLHGFIINGSIDMVTNWISKDERESPEEITGLLMKAVSKLFA